MSLVGLKYTNQSSPHHMSLRMSPEKHCRLWMPQRPAINEGIKEANPGV